ncbi:MAG: ABC transporter ATP-binding protein [Pseudomonadales bacterium]
MIKAQHITKSVPSYEGTLHILQDISLHIVPAESVAVVGASGSGKSTLLSLLAGLDVPTAGTVVLDGTDITPLSEDERALVRSRLVGFVFQAFQLLPSLTALENVMLPAELKQLPNARQLATHYLERVGLAARTRHYPRQLSGGEQQRVAIARAFASEAPILFADEPTGNLDTKTGARIIDLLFELNQDADRTLVLVTHEERLAKRCARRVQLEAGRMVSE